MSDNSVYYKDDEGNFVPFGIYYGHNYIPDGIWLVKHEEYSSSMTNVDSYLRGLYKLHDFEDLSLTELCSLHDYTEYILGSDEYKELTSKSFTTQEYISCVVSLIFKRNKELENKEKENPKNTII